MRILNVADFNWITGAERRSARISLFDICRKFTLAATRADHLVVEFSDRAVARTAAPFRLRAFGVGAANRRFLQVVEELRPDLILLHFADHITNGSLTEARRLAPGVTIADINIDPIGTDKNRRRLALRSGVADALFVTTAEPGLGRYVGPRGFAAFLPNPVDPSVETGRAFETDVPDFDVLLPVRGDAPRPVGDENLTPSAALHRLRDAVPGIRLSAPGADGQAAADGHRYLKALGSARMGWALSRANDQPLYASDRMAHMFGWGLVGLLDRRPGFDRFYAPDEAGFYGDMDELSRLIGILLADDPLARETAHKGWEKTWRLFHSSRVLGYVLAQIFDDGGAKDCQWPCERWRS